MLVSSGQSPLRHRSTPDLDRAYPARGVGTLWEHRPVTRLDAIAAVLGRSRAILLAESEAPASTTELARRTGVSAAGVSQHLTALRDAGIVQTTCPAARGRTARR
nr:helix-turn-helix domain-containing protein [Microtetraspora sp. NBRC 16547]